MCDSPDGQAGILLQSFSGDTAVIGGDQIAITHQQFIAAVAAELIDESWTRYPGELSQSEARAIAQSAYRRVLDGLEAVE